MNNFSKDQLKAGEPLSVLRDRLVPLYFLHRYQLEGVVKLIGGQDYDYGVKGASSTGVKAVASNLQKEALKTLIKSLDQGTLGIPPHIRKMMPPHAFGYGASRESFATQTGLTFDALGAAHTLSDAVLGMILNKQRAARLVQQKAFDEKQLGFKATLELLIDEFFKQKEFDTEDKAIQKVVQGNLLQHMMRLGQAMNVPNAVRAEVHESLYALSKWLKSQPTYPYANYYSNSIENYFEHPAEIQPLASPKIPDGSPIGSGLRCQ